MRRLTGLVIALITGLASTSAFAVADAAKHRAPQSMTAGQQGPTLGTWGIIALCLALVVVAARFLRLQQRKA